MKVAYFGLPLGALLLQQDGLSLSLAVLSPVGAAGRRRLARTLGAERVIDALAAGARLDLEVQAALEREPPDLLVSWFWTRKLPERWLSLARHGGIGAHPSLLPRHRGPNPYFWTIDSGDAEAGVTLHRLDAGYDTGDILAERRIAVGDCDSWQLARALDGPSLQLLRSVTIEYAAGRPPPSIPQTEDAATWAPEPDGPALHVDFHWSTERVLRRIRALSPVPGLALEVAATPIFVTRAERASIVVQALLPGEAAVVGQPPRLSVRTGDGAIALVSAVKVGDPGELLRADDLARLIAIPGDVMVE